MRRLIDRTEKKVARWDKILDEKYGRKVIDKKVEEELKAMKKEA